MFSYYVTSGSGTSVIFGDLCTSKGLKSWTYLRMKLMKIGTPFKADTLDITLCSREKLRIAWMFQLYFVSVTLKSYEESSFNRWYVIHLAGHLRTAI